MAAMEQPEVPTAVEGGDLDGQTAADEQEEPRPKEQDFCLESIRLTGN